MGRDATRSRSREAITASRMVARQLSHSVPIVARPKTEQTAIFTIRPDGTDERQLTLGTAGVSGTVHLLRAHLD
jgi:hypothetical protein